MPLPSVFDQAPKETKTALQAIEKFFEQYPASSLACKDVFTTTHPQHMALEELIQGLSRNMLDVIRQFQSPMLSQATLYSEALFVDAVQFWKDKVNVQVTEISSAVSTQKNQKNVSTQKNQKNTSTQKSQEAKHLTPTIRQALLAKLQALENPLPLKNKPSTRSVALPSNATAKPLTEQSAQTLQGRINNLKKTVIAFLDTQMKDLNYSLSSVVDRYSLYRRDIYSIKQYYALNNALNNVRAPCNTHEDRLESCLQKVVKKLKIPYASGVNARPTPTTADVTVKDLCTIATLDTILLRLKAPIATSADSKQDDASKELSAQDSEQSTIVTLPSTQPEACSTSSERSAAAEPVTNHTAAPSETTFFSTIGDTSASDSHEDLALLNEDLAQLAPADGWPTETITPVSVDDDNQNRLTNEPGGQERIDDDDDDKEEQWDDMGYDWDEWGNSKTAPHAFGCEDTPGFEDRQVKRFTPYAAETTTDEVMDDFLEFETEVTEVLEQAVVVALDKEIKNALLAARLKLVEDELDAERRERIEATQFANSKHRSYQTVESILRRSAERDDDTAIALRQRNTELKLSMDQLAQHNQNLSQENLQLQTELLLAQQKQFSAETSVEAIEADNKHREALRAAVKDIPKLIPPTQPVPTPEKQKDESDLLAAFGQLEQKIASDDPAFLAHKQTQLDNAQQLIAEQKDAINAMESEFRVLEAEHLDKCLQLDRLSQNLADGAIQNNSLNETHHNDLLASESLKTQMNLLQGSIDRFSQSSSFQTEHISALMSDKEDLAHQNKDLTAELRSTQYQLQETHTTLEQRNEKLKLLEEQGNPEQRTELERLRENLDVQKTDLDVLHIQLAKLQPLAEKFQSAQADIKSHKENESRLQEHIETLQQNLSKTDKTLIQNKEILHNTSLQHKQVVETLQAAFQSEQARASQLTEALNERRDQDAISRQIQEMLTNENKQFQQENERLQSKLHIYQASTEILQQTTEISEQKAAELEKSLNAIALQLQSEKSAQQNSVQQLQLKQSAQEKLEKNLSVVSSELDRLRQDSDAQTIQIREVNNAHLLALQKSQYLEKDLQSAQADITARTENENELQQNIETLKQQLAKTNETLSLTQETLQDTSLQHQQGVEALQNEQDKAAQLAEALNERLNHDVISQQIQEMLVNENKQFQKDNEELQSELKNHRNKAQGLQKTTASLEQEVVKLKEECSAITLQLQSEQSTHLNSRQELEQERERLQTDYQSFGGKCDEMLTELNQAALTKTTGHTEQRTALDTLHKGLTDSETDSNTPHSQPETPPSLREELSSDQTDGKGSGLESNADAEGSNGVIEPLGQEIALEESAGFPGFGRSGSGTMVSDKSNYDEVDTVPTPQVTTASNEANTVLDTASLHGSVESVDTEDEQQLGADSSSDGVGTPSPAPLNLVGCPPTSSDTLQLSDGGYESDNNRQDPEEGNPSEPARVIRPEQTHADKVLFEKTVVQLQHEARERLTNELSFSGNYQPSSDLLAKLNGAVSRLVQRDFQTAREKLLLSVNNDSQAEEGGMERSSVVPSETSSGEEYIQRMIRIPLGDGNSLRPTASLQDNILAEADSSSRDFMNQNWDQTPSKLAAQYQSILRHIKLFDPYYAQAQLNLTARGLQSWVEREHTELRQIQQDIAENRFAAEKEVLAEKSQSIPRRSPFIWKKRQDYNLVMDAIDEILLQKEFVENRLLHLAAAHAALGHHIADNNENPDNSLINVSSPFIRAHAVTSIKPSDIFDARKQLHEQLSEDHQSISSYIGPEIYNTIAFLPQKTLMLAAHIKTTARDKGHVITVKICREGSGNQLYIDSIDNNPAHTKDSFFSRRTPIECHAHKPPYVRFIAQTMLEHAQGTGNSPEEKGTGTLILNGNRRDWLKYYVELRVQIRLHPNQPHPHIQVTGQALDCFIDSDSKKRQTFNDQIERLVAKRIRELGQKSSQEHDDCVVMNNNVRASLRASYSASA